MVFIVVNRVFFIFNQDNALLKADLSKAEDNCLYGSKLYVVYLLKKFPEYRI